MASEIISTEMVVALTGTMGAIGAGFKFAWNSVAKRIRDSEVRLEAERIQYELKLNSERERYESVIADQIKEMRREMAQQDREIWRLRRISDAYVNHIATLEQLMRKAGIEIPSLVLPAYPGIQSDDA